MSTSSSCGLRLDEGIASSTALTWYGYGGGLPWWCHGYWCCCGYNRPRARVGVRVSLDLRLEAHVDHAVGLVEHHVVALVEHHVPAVQRVVEAARRRHHDLGALAGDEGLLLDAQSAHDRVDADLELALGRVGVGLSGQGKGQP